MPLSALVRRALYSMTRFTCLESAQYGQHTRFIGGRGDQYVDARYVVGASLSVECPAQSPQWQCFSWSVWLDRTSIPRESPTFVLMDLLKSAAQKSPISTRISVISPMREHTAWTGTRSVGWNQRAALTP
jgi:hypothetical protein